MTRGAITAVTQEPTFQEFNELFHDHHALIYRTAFGITGNSEDAEDVLQTIFARLLSREFPPDLRRNPRAYLYRAAVNESLNALRSRRRQVQLDDFDSPSVLSVQIQSGDGDDATQRLLDAISQLRAAEVEILMLRYAHDYSDAQIAKLLGTTRGTIAVSLFRSRAKLKKMMRAAGEKV